MNRKLLVAVIGAAGLVMGSSAALADSALLSFSAKPKTPAKERPKNADSAAKPAAAASAVLKVGDPAPPVRVAKTIKGTPIDSFEPGDVYVVEFWATWCPPCRESIPHLTSLAKKFSGKAQFLGVSVWESDQAAVEPFVTKMGETMKYTVATDSVPKGKGGNEGAMAQSWMTASGRKGIPSAFIVDGEGKIAWMGHPTDDAMEKKLVELTAKKATEKTPTGAAGAKTPGNELTADPRATPDQKQTPASKPAKPAATPK